MGYYITVGLIALPLWIGSWSLHMRGATPARELRSRTEASSDTLVYRTRPDRTFIITLPDSAGQKPVIRYTPLRIPALSWLVDRSFFWYIRPQDRGIFHLLFHREQPELSPDTLIVTVYVED